MPEQRYEIRRLPGELRWNRFLAAVASCLAGVMIIAGIRAAQWTYLPVSVALSALVWLIMLRGERAAMVIEGDTLTIQNTLFRYELHRPDVREFVQRRPVSEKFAKRIDVRLANGRRISGEASRSPSSPERDAELAAFYLALTWWLHPGDELSGAASSDQHHPLTRE